MIVVKISDKAKYKYLVDLIDELNLMKIDRFSLDDFTESDAKLIATLASPGGEPEQQN